MIAIVPPYVRAFPRRAAGVIRTEAIDIRASEQQRHIHNPRRRELPTQGASEGVPMNSAIIR